MFRASLLKRDIERSEFALYEIVQGDIGRFALRGVQVPTTMDADYPNFVHQPSDALPAHLLTRVA